MRFKVHSTRGQEHCTRVYESFHAFIDVSNDAWGLGSDSNSAAPGSLCIARESPRDYERLRENQHDGALAGLSDRCQPGV